ncbi:MAG: hypothetical protein GC137_09200, partial [Alphaproteobacteria bacterium]|nr:hypothetical protein [Alphaproteobacteria bacterium]
MARFLLIIFLIFSSPAHAYELENQRLLDDFYLKRDGEPLWMVGANLSEDGQTALKTLENAWQHGLNPHKYHVKTISQIFVENTYQERLDPENAIDIELLLTDGIARYIQDLSGIRVDARTLNLNSNDWRQRKTYSQALEKLLNVSNMSEFLAGQAPQSQAYQKMKQALESYVLEKKQTKSFKQLDVEEVLLPGRGHNSIPALRERFGLAEPSPERRFMYDDGLVAAIKVFQSQKGLRPDGVIGKETLRALNQNPFHQIKQLIANME